MAYETGLAKLDGDADGSGKRELELGEVLPGGRCICRSLNAIPACLSNHSTEIKEEIYALAKVEAVEDTTTVNPLSCCFRSKCKTTGEIGSDIPYAGLFVAPESVCKAPEEVTGEEVLTGAKRNTILTSYIIGKAKPVETAADEGSPPLTKGNIYGKTAHSLYEGDTALVAKVKTGIPTSAKADPSVVKSLVGLISTTNDFTVLVTVCILLSKSIHGEKEACCCKSSKNHFDTFHNFVLTLINFAVLYIPIEGLSMQI